VARRSQFASWVGFTAVVPAVVIATLGLAGRAPVRARPPEGSPAQGGPPAPPAGVANSAPSPEVPGVPPPLPTGPAPDLDLVFTDQVIGYVEPCG